MISRTMTAIETRPIHAPAKINSDSDPSTVSQMVERIRSAMVTHVEVKGCPPLFGRTETTLVCVRCGDVLFQPE